MARIMLSRIPASGRDLEDYVAGMFQAAGYFVEKNIRQRDVADVLELDAVATSYDDPLPRSVLAEAKGGRWGFTDIFKVAGWMQYLGIDRGGFFVKDHASTPARDVALVHRTAAPLGVSLVDLGDFSDPIARFGEGGFRGLVDPVVLEVWRFSYWVERTLLDKVREDRRSMPARKGALAVLVYHDLINDHVFFIKDVAERLRRLYAAYRDHPKLSAAVASELGASQATPDEGAPRAGESFDEAARPRRRGPPRDNRVLAEALYEGKHPCVQASFYVEHRARLSILKAAIDLCCLATAAPAGGAGRDDARATLAALPATFRDGLRRLRARPTFHRYALLWQVFLWGFGGFYLADREAEEFAWLSRQTGVPRGEIGEALRAFDDLFPLPEGSWIVPIKNSPVRLMRMMPLAFRGVGAVQRLRRREAKNYDGFGAGWVGRRNLITWHNGLIQLLAGCRPKGSPDRAPAAARASAG